MPNALESDQQRDESKKFPIVSAKLESFAKKLFSRGNAKKGSADVGPSKKTMSSSITREQAHTICLEWTKKSAGRYKIMAHLNDIGWRPNKNWFLIKDTATNGDRLMSWFPLADCVALEGLSGPDSPKSMLKELLVSLQHPCVYPVVDLDIFSFNQNQYVGVVMGLSSGYHGVFGSLKDTLYSVEMKVCFYKKFGKCLFHMPSPISIHMPVI